MSEREHPRPNLAGISNLSGVHVRTEDGNDTVNGAPTVATAATLPLWIYGGDGNDTITGGNGGDTIVPGSGQNVIHEGNGWNSPEIVDDSDGVRSGVNNSFQAGNAFTGGPGFNGSEQIHAKAASSTAAATWSFANLPATGYYDVYVTWSPQAGASTAAQYVVSDGGAPIEPVDQTICAKPERGSGRRPGRGRVLARFGRLCRDAGQHANRETGGRPQRHGPGRCRAARQRRPRAAGNELDHEQFCRQCRWPACGDLHDHRRRFPALYDRHLPVGRRRAAHKPRGHDRRERFGGPHRRHGRGTQHTLTYDGDLSGLDSGQYYLARLDAYEQVTETTKADNLSAPLSGVFEDSDGSLYAVTGLDGNSHSLTFSQDAATGDLIVDLDGSAQAFQNAGTINVVAYQGTNSIDAAGVNLPMTIYGGDGSDAITGGDGGNTIYGGTAGGNVIYAGAGDDTIYGGGSAGGGHNAIYGGAGSDTIYAGDGGDAITGGTGNDEIYGGTGNDTLTAGSGDNWIQAGSGDDTITGGPDQDWLIAGSGDDVIQGGSGNEVIEGGSGTDTLIGGGGLDNITGGSGTNFIYGNGQHDVLQGGTGKNYILPAPDAGDNLASIQVENAGTGTPLGSYSNNGEFTSDGTIDAEGNPVQADYDPGYGGVWNFADFDSGVRLGESTVTPVAVYATWATGDPDHELPSGDHWAHDAVYEVRDGSTPLGSIPVDQSLAPGSNDPPEPNDRPWTLLGVWNVPFGHTLTVVLYNGSDSAHPDPGGVVCVSDVMIHPLWPTVSIRSTDVTVNSKAVGERRRSTKIGSMPATRSSRPWRAAGQGPSCN